uniref:Uncharacterized protein n=1 Tax=mine drainage metagenome TaxID=410659 RepID=E6PZM1_9ZZZZ
MKFWKLSLAFLFFVLGTHLALARKQPK